MYFIKKIAIFSTPGVELTKQLIPDLLQLSVIMFHSSEIALAVITYYPKWYRGKLRSIKHTDKVRGDLAIEFLQKASQAGFQTVVADGKSSKTFRKTIARIPKLIIIERKSLQSSVAKKQAIKKAAKFAGTKVIVLTEPEKISLLEFIPRLASPILENKADIVVPKRDESLFRKTYPSYMYDSEIEGNKLYNETLKTRGLLRSGEDLDTFFGPRLFAQNRKLVSLFTREFHLKIDKTAYLYSYFDKNAYSATLYFPLVIALKKKYRVKSVTIPFSYPKSQKENEERGARELFEEKRKHQRIVILVELLYFLNFLKKK